MNFITTLFSPITTLWNWLIFIPVFNILLFIQQYTHNMGWSIILMSFGLRLALSGVILKTLKIQKLQLTLAPELAKLKEVHKDNKQQLMLAQAELYKKNGFNPSAGCLPTIIMFAVMFSLTKSIDYIYPNKDRPVALEKVNQSIVIPNLKQQEVGRFEKTFFYADVTKPDIIPVKFSGMTLPLPGVFILLSTILQFMSMKMSAPLLSAEKKIAAKTPGRTDDDMASAMAASTNIMPLMNIIIGYQFPSIIMIYFIPFTLIQVIQQYFVTGWGGLTPWFKRFGLVKSAQS